MDLTPYGAKEGENWIADGVFQEIDLETGKVLFEGSTLDFASPAALGNTTYAMFDNAGATVEAQNLMIPAADFFAAGQFDVGNNWWENAFGESLPGQGL
ncbi:hypothetical protein MBLNU230_g5246t1 [Neophaeotheca triangularis]